MCSLPKILVSGSLDSDGKVPFAMAAVCRDSLGRENANDTECILLSLFTVTLKLHLSGFVGRLCSSTENSSIALGGYIEE